MKFGVVVFPGSNCDRDMLHVLGKVLGYEVVKLWHKDTSLSGLNLSDCIVLPGGFSFGDYLRTGAIARFSPIMNSVIEHANKGGKVMGICNGFQILCESGLLPGVLLRNQYQKFICKNVYINVVNTESSYTHLIPKNSVLKIPIAHAEGRYYCDSNTLSDLHQYNQILFRYCDESGQNTEDSNFNGSIDSIAGITNKAGNVMGMMPHPERCTEEILSNTDGLGIFKSIVSYSMAQ